MSQRFPASCPTSHLSSDDTQKNALPPANSRDETNQRSDQWQPSAPQNWVCDHLLHPLSEPTPQKLDRAKGNLGLQTMLNPTCPAGHQTPGKSYNDNPEALLPKTDQNPQIKSQGLSLNEKPLVFNSHLSNENISEDSPLNLRRILTPRAPSRTVSSSKAAPYNELNSQIFPSSSAVQHYHPLSPRLSALSKALSDPNSSMTGAQNYKESYDRKYSDKKFTGNPLNTSLKLPTYISTSSKSSPTASTSPPFHQTTVQNPPVNLINQGQSISPGNMYYHSNSSFGDPSPLIGGIRRPLENTEGLYSIPVDVHHASRLADEKRARNAGASARFRQRRKEKEKEASLAIGKLKSQVRDIEKALEDMKSQRNFYRSERDRLRQILLRNAETRHLAMQAPPSPCAGRYVSFPGQAEILSPVEPSFVSSHKTNLEGGSRKRRTYIEESSTEASSMAPMVSAQRSVSSGLSVNDIIQPQEYRSISVSIPPTRRWSNLPQQTNPNLTGQSQRSFDYPNSRVTEQGSAGYYHDRERRYNLESPQ